MLKVPASREIAVLNRMNKARALVSEMDIAFGIEAVRVQLREHLPQLYPGEPVWNIGYYSSIEDVDIANVWPVILTDFDDREGSDAVHWAVAGLIGGSVDMLYARNWVKLLSHEATEIAGNPYLLNWRTVPPTELPGIVKPTEADLDRLGISYGKWMADAMYSQPRENADPVQNDMYYEAITLGGEKRSVPLSNFVGQRYFGEDAPPDQPLDYMRKLHRVGQIGNGYRVLKGEGRRTYEYGWSSSPADSPMTMGARNFTGASRSNWLMRGKGFNVVKNSAGFTAWAPSEFPGCMANAPTEEDALHNARSLLIQQTITGIG